MRDSMERASTTIVPDLLHPSPSARLDLAVLEGALDFAFAAGGTYSEIDDCLDRRARVPSSWDPACFERAVFLRELLARSFPIVIDGRRLAPDQKHLGALVAHPPDDPEVARFRQEVLRELAESPALRRDLERLYVSVRRFKELLGPKDPSEQAEIARRRMEILTVAHEVIELLAGGFEAARSGLARLRAFGVAVRETEAFRSLGSLLELEGHLAGLDVHVRVGADGTLRSLVVVKLRENRDNPLYASPFRRLLRKIEQLIRGYRWSDDEVLEAMVDTVFAALRGELVKLFQLHGDLEIYLAALGFRDVAKARGLDVCLPELAALPAGGAPAARGMERLFNPHLLGEQRAPVPCTLDFPRHDAIALVTGPNSGGKTRLLQALALAQVLGQAGLFVPAKSARLVWAEGMFVSLIEDAKPDQREGRLGTELMRIRDLFERLRPGGAVMLDELCSGTNPSEGQEIFELVTTLLADLRPQAFITTHFLDFAASLAERDAAGRLTFLQVELDRDEEPTYQFVPGVAKTSLAGKTAARLGVTRDDLRRLVERTRRSG